MKLPRPVVWCLLTFFVLTNLALRYPRTPHEVGIDSFFIHNLATNIANDGHAEWILNPLSWFGWYPLSYPSGGPVVVADLAMVSGLPIEAAILFLSLGFGGLGVLTSFIMAREFRDDDLFCLIVAFVYGFAPRYLAFTLWSASMRSLFMVLLPVFIWIVLRSYREGKRVHVFLILVFFLTLAATHRLAALLAVVMISFIAAISLLVLLKVLRLQFPKIVLASPYRRTSPYLALGAFAATAGLMIFGTDVLSVYSEGELAAGTTMDVQLLNFGVSLGRSVGMSLVFALAGVIVLVRAKNKTFREPFILISFLGLTPTLFLRQYTGFYILPFIAIFAALAIAGVSRLRQQRIRSVVLVASFTVIFVFSAAVLEYEIERTSVLPPSLYSTSLYAGHYACGQGLISNDGLLGIRVAAITGCAYIPVGGAGTTFQSPELLAYGFFNRDEVESKMARVPLQDLTLDSDSLWAAYAIQAEADWVAIMNSPYNSRSSVTDRYHPTYYLENKFHASMFFAFGNRYPSPFAVSAHDGAYKLYDGTAETLWYTSPSGG